MQSRYLGVLEQLGRNIDLSAGRKSCWSRNEVDASKFKAGISFLLLFLSLNLLDVFLLDRFWSFVSRLSHRAKVKETISVQDQGTTGSNERKRDEDQKKEGVKLGLGLCS